MTLVAVPISQRAAARFVLKHHRHNKPPRGSLFQVAAYDGELLVGVAIGGRPVARGLQDGFTFEVLRCCVLDNAPKNSNSFLYACLWRAGRALGYRRLITFTLLTESGASLRAAGFKVVHALNERPEGKAWNSKTRKRDWQEVYGQKKLRWEALA